MDEQLEKKIEAVKAVLTEVETQFSPATFANSYGAEDMVLTDLICKHHPGIEIFSLDTGRLPEETYTLMQKTQQHYDRAIVVYFPEASQVEDYVRTHGPNAFYDSVELRKQCCHIRKVKPLQRALKGKKAWITGMRREQTVSRNELPVSEWDEAHQCQKFNPLSDWTEKDVWNYIRHFDIPYNELHDKFFPSIGCAPCTRSVTVGEDIRSGRWWWENEDVKECGLHVKKPGR